MFFFLLFPVDKEKKKRPLMKRSGPSVRDRRSGTNRSVSSGDTQALPSFTGFYRVLPSYCPGPRQENRTERIDVGDCQRVGSLSFCRVLPGFT